MLPTPWGPSSLSTLPPDQALESDMEMFYTALTPKRVMRARVHSDVGSSRKVWGGAVKGAREEELPDGYPMDASSTLKTYPLPFRGHTS